MIERIRQRIAAVAKEACGYAPLTRVISEAEVTEIFGQEEKTGGWIPVTERLPEESLNSVIGWDTYRNRCCFVQFFGERFVLGDDTDSVKITAWMPLPKPYKMEEENEN